MAGVKHGARARPAGRLIGALAALALAFGLAAQAAFTAREARRQLSEPVHHRLRGFLEDADRVMAPGATFTATSFRVGDAARYLLYPHPRVTADLTRKGLEQAGVRYVVVTPRHRPASLTGQHGWYRVVLTDRQGRVLELTP
jgi:hypothetical protein